VNLSTHQGISLVKKIVHVHHSKTEAHLMEQVVYNFCGKKEHQFIIVLLQLKIISCSAT